MTRNKQKSGKELGEMRLREKTPIGFWKILKILVGMVKQKLKLIVRLSRKTGEFESRWIQIDLARNKLFFLNVGVKTRNLRKPSTF